MSVFVIGISGKKLSGKDTLCNLLLKHATVKGVRIGFADALKEEVARACGVTVDHINLEKARYRSILQWWGTDFRRHFKGEDYWVMKAMEKINKAVCEGKQLIILPDVRFKSEAEPLNYLGASLVRVSRPEMIPDSHPSETELDTYNKFHDIILNSGTLSHLEEEAVRLLNKLHIPNK